MVLSLNTMPNCLGDFSISTYNLTSIQELIFKLQQQVAEFAASNKCWKIHIAALQQSYNAFIEEEEKNPENSDQEAKITGRQATISTEIQPKIHTTTPNADPNLQHSSPTISEPEITTSIIQQKGNSQIESTDHISGNIKDQIQNSTDFQPKTQTTKHIVSNSNFEDHKKNNNYNKVQSPEEEKLDHRVEITDLSILKSDAFAKDVRAKTVRSTQSDLHRSHRESGAPTELATTVIRGGNSEQSGGDTHGSRGGDVAHEEVADSGNNCSSAEDDAFAARAKESTSDDEDLKCPDGGAEHRSGSEDSASAEGTTAAHSAPLISSSGGDLRLCQFCRLGSVATKPPPLRATALPWDVDGCDRTEKMAVMGVGLQGSNGGGRLKLIDGDPCSMIPSSCSNTYRKNVGGAAGVAAATGTEKGFGAFGISSFGSRFGLLGLNKISEAQNG